MNIKICGKLKKRSEFRLSGYINSDTKIKCGKKYKITKITLSEDKVNIIFSLKYKEIEIKLPLIKINNLKGNENDIKEIITYFLNATLELE